KGRVDFLKYQRKMGASQYDGRERWCRFRAGFRPGTMRLDEGAHIQRHLLGSAPLNRGIPLDDRSEVGAAKLGDACDTAAGTAESALNGTRIDLAGAGPHRRHY